MVSRSEIVGLALVGFALLTKFRGNGDSGFIVNPSSFVRQASVESSIILPPVIPPDPRIAEIAFEKSSLVQERTGLLQGLNNLITPFFRRGFSFDTTGSLKKKSGFKFRVTAGSSGIFGFRSAQTSSASTNRIINSNPRKIATEATLNFGVGRVREINQLLTGFNTELESL